jgi:hypothetical protein
MVPVIVVIRFSNNTLQEQQQSSRGDRWKKEPAAYSNTSKGQYNPSVHAAASHNMLHKS